MDCTGDGWIASWYNLQSPCFQADYRKTSRLQWCAVKNDVYNVEEYLNLDSLDDRLQFWEGWMRQVYNKRGFVLLSCSNSAEKKISCSSPRKEKSSQQFFLKWAHQLHLYIVQKKEKNWLDLTAGIMSRLKLGRECEGIHTVSSCIL